MKKLLFLILLISSVALSQLRDSLGYLVTSPSGKPMRIAQFSLGSTDTNTRKPAGALAYKSGALYLSNGTYWVSVAGSGSSGDTSTFVTKATTQVISASKYFTARQYMNSLDVDTLFASPQKVLEVAKNGRQYTSIQSAITSASYGDIILVYPGTYSENVVFYASDSGKSLVALDRNTTTIDSLKIYGKDVSVSNIAVSGVLKVLSQNTFSYPKTINLYNNKFLGDSYFGTADSSLKYAVKVFNCLFAYDTSKQIMINNGSGEEYSINIYNSEIPKMKLRAVGGRGNWYYSSLGLSLLEYVTANTTTNINFENCDSNIDSVITLLGNTLAYHIFVVRGGSTGNYLASVGTTNSTWTISGLFELDILDSRFYYPNIVFNSTANSRFMHVRGHGYNNANTITGTGLSKLYIQGSMFKCAPPSGLGNNVLNVWYAFVDN